MRWRPWRKKLVEQEKALRAAEELRDRAQAQQRRAVNEIAPRVDEVASSLRRLRTENHFGPMIDSILRGMSQ